MRILGIESSCDETGAAVYDDRQGLLSHVLHSQIKLHAAYGGVVPELASRDHIRWMRPLIEEALCQAGTLPEHLCAVAYTAGPGLIGALLTGAVTACSMAAALGIPNVPVHHMEGHLLAPLLEDRRPDFPFVALLISGGHTLLVWVGAPGRYEILGQSVDDAAGEAFDKVGKLLGTDYPGGPEVEKLAARGADSMFTLPRPMLRSGDLNFSFAGLKTAVLRCMQDAPATDEVRCALAKEFVSAVSETLCAKSAQALRQQNCRRLLVAGGVSANRQIRAALNATAQEEGAEIFFARPEFCTDNAAMIALAGMMRFQAGQTGDRPQARPRWELSSLPEMQERPESPGSQNTFGRA